MFRKIIKKEESRPQTVFTNLYQMLKDKEAAAQLVKKGYVVLPFLNASVVRLLNQQKDIYLNSIGKKLGDLFYTSGRDEVKNRNKVKELTWQIIEPLLTQIVNIEITNSEGCAFLLKPPGDQSSLSPHQDSSLIDETKFTAFYGWVALQDTTIENGCMHAIPGSHLWGNHYRSLDVPWAFEKYTDLLLEYSKPIEMKAGELLLFDTALIHGSYPNKSNELRAALNLFFKPKSASMMHYARFEDTPKGKIESYRIDNDFFFNEDYRKRPNDTIKYPFLGYVDQIDLKLSEKKIRKWCTQNK